MKEKFSPKEFFIGGGSASARLGNWRVGSSSERSRRRVNDSFLASFDESRVDSTYSKPGARIRDERKYIKGV